MTPRQVDRRATALLIFALTFIAVALLTVLHAPPGGHPRVELRTTPQTADHPRSIP